MRIAALYDIHGNLPALEAVLASMEAERIDHVVIGGDVVAGPFPSESIRLLRNLPIPTHFVRGNAESEAMRAADKQPPGGLAERANEEARWLASKLSPSDLRFISEWKPAVELDTTRWGHILFCHATPISDTRVFTCLTPEVTIAPDFEGMANSIFVCGHTHLPFDRVVVGIRILNAGSVGMPFGRTGADWLLIDDAIEFRHTDYDLELAADRIRQSDYPYAETFAQGNVISVPPEDRALDMLRRLESGQSEAVG